MSNPMLRDSEGESYWPIGKTLRLYPWGPGLADLVSSIAPECHGLIKENINLNKPANWIDWFVVWLATGEEP